VVISTEAVRLLHEYTGRGPTKARTTIYHDSAIILLADALTKGERKLAESGHAERVLQLRHDDNHIDPDLAVEVFVLEPVSA
jgi:uncharacterized protein YbcI